MLPKKFSSQKSNLRLLPSVDALLKTAAARKLEAETGRKNLTAAARAAIENLRRLMTLTNSDGGFSREVLLARAEKILCEVVEQSKREQLQRVINATGIIIHTNLGRAPLAVAAREAILQTVGYCNLEYDLTAGKRGRRGAAVEQMICELTGAQAALVVNNCAAAVLLVLTELGAGGDSIVSRGELVEIGGDFRIPDVMRQSQTRLVEVGTTNRTKLSDFADAVTENTKLFVRVHPSNFRVLGFAEKPGLCELAALAHEKNILLYEDAGSGALFDFCRFGIADEPIIADSVKAGADVVTFSGDKLLGGAQAGLIVGRAEIIEKLRKNPLFRALRVDKTIYAALTATLEIYLKREHLDKIPVWQMLSQTKEEIEQRAKRFLEKAERISDLKFEIVAGASAVGGGSAPLVELQTVLIAVASNKIVVSELERSLRFATPPVIARVVDNRVMLDLRTVSESEADEILSALNRIATEN
jgi:L-seryl-tRNA(Ser) seleniumtransferase